MLRGATYTAAARIAPVQYGSLNQTRRPATCTRRRVGRTPAANICPNGDDADEREPEP